jgi:2-iminoacetate synthase
MSLCKTGQIQNCCQPNALITLKEFLTDYATEETKKIGEEFIIKELDKVENEAVKRVLSNNLKEIENGKRDFRF